MSRITRLILVAALTSAALLGCNELVGSGDFDFGDTDAGMMDAGPRPDGGPDAGRDAGDAGETPTYRRFSSLTAGERFSCAVLDGATPAENQVLCWGLNKNARLGRGVDEDVVEGDAAPVLFGLDPLMGAVQVSAGRGHACVVTGEGATAEIRCWGLNNKDQIGNPAAGGSQLTALPVVNEGNPLGGALEVASGDSHSCARVTGGEVYCWGRGGDGQIGDGRTDDRNPVSQVLGVGATGTIADTVALSAGSNASCALPLSAPQAPLCWGEPIDCAGFTSSPGNLAMPFGSAPDIFEVGDDYACALISRGRVECVGLGDVGQLGDGSMSGCSDAPVRVLLPDGTTDLEGATALAVGSTHACASDAGGVICWGGGTAGQLGDGNMVDAPTPVRVIGPGGGDPIGPAPLLAAGYTHTCAVVRAADADDRIVCWGADYGPTPVFITLP